MIRICICMVRRELIEKFRMWLHDKKMCCAREVDKEEEDVTISITSMRSINSIDHNVIANIAIFLSIHKVVCVLGECVSEIGSNKY